MDSPHEEVFDRAVRLATQLTGRPVGLLSLVDGERQFFKAQVGLTGDVAKDRETPLSHSFCQHVVIDGAPLIVKDARDDPRVRDNLAIDDLGVVAYLGVPVHGPDGEPLGSFCVIDGHPHEWSAADLQTLEDLTAMIETDLKLRDTVAQRDLLISEMNHRLKNIFTLIGGMIRQSARDASDPREMAEQITGRVQALNAAHSLVLPDGGTRGHEGGEVALDELAKTVLAPYPGAQKIVRGGKVMLGPKAAVAFALSLHELATNAAKYGAFSDILGKVELDWNVAEDKLGLTWREELPQTLQTTTSDEGFGSRLLQLNVEAQLRGTLVRDMTPNGVHVTLAVPIEALID
ncbi:GAF domain-containing protein [Pseudooctadecabacter sp.]|uniref:GAF domain-containing protein n=1 Tax=Pseudooctadecabacter sp. TaxID=1966338 RepID=UPI0025CC70AC|nr:GAF domain-containing protein [Pseudooctadecabacter sp.]